jgi:hypothetical protein
MQANSLNIEDEFYISTAASDDYKRIYNFGKFNKTQEIEELKVAESVDIPVPNIVCDYSKVILTQKIVLQYQTIYVAKIIESIVLNNNKKPLFHLHKIWFLKHTNIKEIQLVQS